MVLSSPMPPSGSRTQHLTAATGAGTAAGSRRSSAVLENRVGARVVIERYVALEKRLHMMRDLYHKFCNSTSCRDSLYILNASYLSSNDSCADFYDFVCGRWNARGPSGFPQSYTEQLAFNYSIVADRQLARILDWPNAHETDAYKIAFVYKSCVDFYSARRTNLHNMLKAAGVDPKVFLKADSRTHLYSQTIRVCIDTGLTSVIRVVYFQNATAAVLTGTSMMRGSFIPEIREALLEQLSWEFGDDRFSNLSKSITLLDQEIDKITIAFVGNSALKEVPQNQPHVYWEERLNAFRPAGMKQIDVRTNSGDGLRRIFDCLTGAPFDAAKVYVLLVPFARYLSFELKTASLRGSYDTSTQATRCLHYLHASFGARVHSVLMNVLGYEKAITLSRRMWRHLKKKAETMTKLDVGITLMSDRLGNATLKTYGGNVHLDDVDAIIPSINYSSDFLENLIMIARHTHEQTELKPTRWRPDSKTEVGTEFLQPDFVYADATEPSVNYGTLGGYLARILFNIGVPKNVSSEYADCLGDYAEHKGFPFDKRTWRDYATVKWALQLTLATMREAPNYRGVLEDRLFFLRYAVHYCGADWPSKTSFNLAVRTSRSFATAFECEALKELTCP
ncbi:hypothetical protein HPB48_023499 [Haemaphysalis longicornis]|uniref:Uncharacterized protein n=1 Tax=Haemaphysalis longicornis TaxID=44386 RepID=A0A9J6H778_HAELO|nr:hypothetical protein HPB48_023499 [Haemaphysalis longicornis]